MSWVWFGPKDLKGSTWALQVSKELDIEDYTQISLRSLLFLARCVIMCLGNKFLALDTFGMCWEGTDLQWSHCMRLAWHMQVLQCSVFCVWFSALCLFSLPFTFPSPRSSQRKCSLGKPDQRELNENLAATQGLAHMIMECNRLFQVHHSLSPSKSSGHPGEGVAGLEQQLGNVPVTDGSPAAAPKEKMGVTVSSPPLPPQSPT